MTENKLAIYITDSGEVALEVEIKDNSIWLSQAQIAELFAIDRTVVTRHIGNIFRDDELEEASNVQKMHIANADRPVKYYSLDVVISVGYRVNSKKATQFRIWANRVLQSYLQQGYVINQKRLENQAEAIIDLHKEINFIRKKSKFYSSEGQAEALLQIIDESLEKLNKSEY